MECCSIATEKHKSDFEVTAAAVNEKNMNACKKNDEATVESMSRDEVILEGEITTQCKIMDQDYVQEDKRQWHIECRQEIRNM